MRIVVILFLLSGSAYAQARYFGLVLGSLHVGNDNLNNFNSRLSYGKCWVRQSNTEWHLEEGGVGGDSIRRGVDGDLLARDFGGSPRMNNSLLRVCAWHSSAMPFFKTFDEERTSAACRMMERIGGSGQAIYFTHHRHVVDIAAAECGIEPVLHEL